MALTTYGSVGIYGAEGNLDGTLPYTLSGRTFGDEAVDNSVLDVGDNLSGSVYLGNVEITFGFSDTVVAPVFQTLLGTWIINPTLEDYTFPEALPPLNETSYTHGEGYFNYFISFSYLASTGQQIPGGEPGTIFDRDGDFQFESGDSIFIPPFVLPTFVGTAIFDGVRVPVFGDGTTNTYYYPLSAVGTGSSISVPTTAPEVTSSEPFAFCFAAGTRIATPDGETAVEDLRIGDLVHTADGRAVPIKWLGRQTLFPAFVPNHRTMVRIAAGALEAGLPDRDLLVTSDHGMILDGVVINAGALVNGATIIWEPAAKLPARMTVYHVETEAHNVILANGAAAETFVDYVGRRAFENYDEYVALYRHERLIPQMDRPRITTARQLPEAVRQRLSLVPGATAA